MKIEEMMEKSKKTWVILPIIIAVVGVGLKIMKSENRKAENAKFEQRIKSQKTEQLNQVNMSQKYTLLKPGTKTKIKQQMAISCPSIKHFSDIREKHKMYYIVMKKDVKTVKSFGCEVVKKGKKVKVLGKEKPDYVIIKPKGSKKKLYTSFFNIYDPNK